MSTSFTNSVLHSQTMSQVEEEEEEPQFSSSRTFPCDPDCPPPLPARPVMSCNLCGSISGSVVACEDCSSMIFCSSCDDMYHRHPKRKFHVRKSVAHPVTRTQAAMDSLNKPPIPGPRLPVVFQTMSNSGHPSKMPIPPPRRKKSLRSLSSLDGEIFASNQSLEKAPNPSNQTQVMFPPFMNRPGQNQTFVNQTNDPLANRSRTLGPTRQNFSSENDLVASQMQPQQQQQSFQQQQPYIDPQILNGNNLRARSSNLRQKNSSLQDFRGVYDPMMLPGPYLPGPGYGYNPYVYPQHPGHQMMGNPWDYQSVDMEDDQATSEDEVDEEEEFPSEVASRTSNTSKNGQNMQKSRALDHRNVQNVHRGHGRDLRTSTLARSYSSYQLPVWPAPPPPPPHPYYAYGGYPNPYGHPASIHPSFYGHSSLASSSPMGSLQSLTMRRKKSFDMLSTTSSRRGGHRRDHRHKRRETSVDRSQNKHSHSHRSRSKPRSYLSSRYESESEFDADEDEVYSDDESDTRSRRSGSNHNLSAPRSRKIGDRIRGSLEKLMTKSNDKPWNCKYCTFVNAYDKEICEICYKSNPKKLNEKVLRRKKSSSPAETKIPSTSQNASSIAESLQVSDDLVREQLEIEREMKRRIENEKRVEEENKKIEEQLKQTMQLLPEPTNPNIASNDDEEEDEELVSETIDHKEDQDKLTKNYRRSPVKKWSRYTSRRDEDDFEGDGKRSKYKPSESRSKSRTNSRKQEDEEDDDEKEMEAIESLISTLAKQKLDIQKIEQFISSAAASKQNEQPQAIAMATSVPQVAQLAPIQSQQPIAYSSQQPFVPQFNQPSFQNPPMSQFQGYQGSYYEPMAQRPAFESAMARFSGPVMDAAPPLPIRSQFNNYGSNSSRFGMSGSSDCLSPSSGVGMIKVLREAERKGYSADDVEVALNFNDAEPIEWLDNNWMNMIETVLRLANNQIIKNQTSKGGKTSKNLNLVTERDAKIFLRKTKGNLWQAVEKSIQKKEEEDKCKDFTIEVNERGNGRENEEMNAISNPNVALFHPDDSDEEGDEELINLFIEKWKFEKEQELEQLKERKDDDDHEDHKLFDSYDDDDEEVRMVLEREVKADEAKNTFSKAKEKFFSSVEELENISKNGPETGKDLRKYLFNKYFGDQNNLSDGEENSRSSEAQAGPSTSTKDKSPSKEVKIHEDDEYEYYEVEEIESEPEVSCEVPGTHDSRKAFFGGKNLDEYVTAQDDVAVAETKITPDVKVREIDTNLGQSFEFLMSLNVDDLDADDTISELMRISSEKPKETLLEVKDQHVGVMSRSESPRFMVEPQADSGFVKITQKSFSGRFFSPRGSRTDLHKILDTKYYECELCATPSVPVHDMVTMLACEHQACSECIKTYLSVQIRERPSIVICCPFCKEPEIAANDDDAVWNYVSLLDQLVKNLLPQEIHELYQRKIRDRTLAKDPSFRWCPSCSSGFIASNNCAATVMCPDCQTVTCIKCNEPWVAQHLDISCEQFREWKRANDPSLALKQLDQHLKLFGIDCPNCNFHYELSKGGCMHFHCVQCSFDFCGGCQKQFVNGFECKGSPYCERLGLHAHHPRNCLFYLRDKEPEVLKKLLDDNKIIYNSPSNLPKGKPCPVMEQKRRSLGYKDENCGKMVEFSGLCRSHYIEYLGQLIMKNNIDPISIFDEHELEMVLKRNSIPLPEKVDYEYVQSVIQVIKEKCPLA